MSASSGESVKACCAQAYSSDLVALVLGDSYHPGGLALTRRIAGLLDLGPGLRVLDVACGRGASALALAAEYGVHVDGLDLSEANVAAAVAAAGMAGLAGVVSFRHGDAERLPYDDATFDAVICECALCTFPGQAAAAAEISRVLRPDGRLGLTDVTANRSMLPPALLSLAARVACIADAATVEEYAALLAAAGLKVRQIERHDAAAAEMVERIEAKLLFARMTLGARARAAGIDLDAVNPVLAEVKQAMAEGHLGYALLVAVKPSVAGS